MLDQYDFFKAILKSNDLIIVSLQFSTSLNDKSLFAIQWLLFAIMSVLENVLLDGELEEFSQHAVSIGS